VISCEEDIGPSGYDEKSEIMSTSKYIRLMQSLNVILTRELIEILSMDSSPIARVASDLVMLYEELGDMHIEIIVRKREMRRRKKLTINIFI
jgi:hypothetical protein